MKYLAMTLAACRQLEGVLADTTRADERRELERMIAMADWYNWGPGVHLQWRLEDPYPQLGIALKRCAEFFEIPFEERVYN